jgi:CubicO group peptidase (beta-lactamase class C family)
MRKTTLLLLVLAAAIFAMVSCTGQKVGPGASTASFTAYLDEQVPRLMDRYRIPGVSMALIHDGEPVWTGAYGYADLVKGKEMTTDAVCRTESISKSVTAWGLMRLVERGRIDLDEPVEQYLGGWELPESDYAEEAVTIRRLLSNSGGFPLGTVGPAAEYEPGSEMPSLRDYLEKEARLVREPGSGFEYSNPGFNLLELVVEETTGLSFTDYMAREVLAPLSMENASYIWKESFGSKVPTGYEPDGTPVPPYVYPVSASGGLLADVEAIARFAIAEMRGPFYTAHGVLTEESLEVVHTPVIDIPGMYGVVADSYGFGHFIEDLPDGRKAVWHGGQGHGWMTHFHVVPEAGEGIIILTNSQRSWPFLALILTDWAEWAGLGSVKFGRITTATIVLRIFILIAVVAALWLVYRLVLGLYSGIRRFAPFSKAQRAARIVLAAAGLGIIALIVWRASRPYLFELSIFPSAVGWAAAAFITVGGVMLISALFPRTEAE